MQQKINFKRQIEILGLALSGKYTLGDFEEIFQCSKATIERDLEELRSMGVRIHSSGKKGVELKAPVPPKLQRELITDYLVISHSADVYDKASALLVKTLQDKSIPILIQLQRAIDKSRTVILDYQKDADSKVDSREAGPILLYQKENSWRLLAKSNGIFKQYLVGKIQAVNLTEKKFTKPPKRQIEQIFEHSFRSWVGEEKIPVKLLLDANWGKVLRLTPVMESQTITEKTDGSYILEGIVSSLGEFASWVASRGDEVKVVEPVQLKKEVIKIGRGILKNY